MSPEFGCTITYFPIDDKTIQYLDKTNRPKELMQLVEHYSKENLLWREHEHLIEFSEVVELQLGSVVPTISGPSRPQDKILLKNSKEAITGILEKSYFRKYVQHSDRPLNRWAGEGGNVQPSEVALAEHSDMRTVKVGHNEEEFHLSDGDVVIAAITSCTNTSNPDVMISAGLLAKKSAGQRTHDKTVGKDQPRSRLESSY